MAPFLMPTRCPVPVLPSAVSHHEGTGRLPWAARVALIEIDSPLDRNANVSPFLCSIINHPHVNNPEMFNSPGTSFLSQEFHTWRGVLSVRLSLRFYCKQECGFDLWSGKFCLPQGSAKNKTRRAETGGYI